MASSRLTMLLVLVALTACSGPGMPIPAKKLDAGEELAWTQCQRFAETDYNAFQRFTLESPKAAFKECMAVHGYKIVTDDQDVLPKSKD